MKSELDKSKLIELNIFKVLSWLNNNGEIIINITYGGTQPFNFLMTGNSISQPFNSFSGLAHGSYNFIVTDINGCQNTISTTLSKHFRK